MLSSNLFIHGCVFENNLAIDRLVFTLLHIQSPLPLNPTHTPHVLTPRAWSPYVPCTCSTDRCWAGPWIFSRPKADNQYFSDPRTRSNYTNNRCTKADDNAARSNLRKGPGDHINGGGAISASGVHMPGTSPARVQISACKFLNNGARYSAGAIAASKAEVSITTSTFTGTQQWPAGLS